MLLLHLDDNVPALNRFSNGRYWNGPGCGGFGLGIGDHNPCPKSTSHPTRQARVLIQSGVVGELLGYVRVSTTEQDTSLQTDALTTAGCTRLFCDHTSGAASHRPQWDRLVEQARSKDTVMVWRLDRLGRSLRQLIDTINFLADHNIGFRSLTEHIDTTNPGGKLVFHIFAALAEFERELISERTHAGLAAARARGRTGGRPTVMTPDKITTAQHMYNTKTHTIAAIADTIGVSRATIYRHLNTPTTTTPNPNPNTDTGDPRWVTSSTNTRFGGR